MIYELCSIHDHMVNLTDRARNYLKIYIFSSPEYSGESSFRSVRAPPCFGM
jgi:hypothetical protein